MTAKPVEWVLIVYYGTEAHRATYGRQVRSNRYTKDYLQLSRKQEFLDAVAKLFAVNAATAESVPLTYHWPKGASPGTFVFRSADRAHLKWETNRGAPQVWKMNLLPSEASVETIPGDPTHLKFEDAERELELLAGRGAGQPYLVAVKLRGEARSLHLRAYLGDPNDALSWASIALTPPEIEALARKTSRTRALQWSNLESDGVLPSDAVKDALTQLLQSQDRAATTAALNEDVGARLASYLRNPGYGLFFDPTRNHAAWETPSPLGAEAAASIEDLLRALEVRFPSAHEDDLVAEVSEVDTDQVDAFAAQIDQKNYAVADSTATTKTRGSAQKAFARAVKKNYGNRCAITGAATGDFLVAAHIVPWSKDQSIRLDPSNGICLSLMVDRAFEKGYLLIEDDLTVRINWDKVGDDDALRKQLESYDGTQLTLPADEPPKVQYLALRRALVLR